MQVLNPKTRLNILAQWARNELKRSKLKPADVAQQMGISHSNLRNKLYKGITYNDAVAIANILGVNKPNMVEAFKSALKEEIAEIENTDTALTYGWYKNGQR